MLVDVGLPLGRLRPPWQQEAAAGEPSVLVDAAIAERLEILDLARARRLGVIEAVGQACAFQWFCLTPLTTAGALMPANLVDGRDNVRRGGTGRGRRPCP